MDPVGVVVVLAALYLLGRPIFKKYGHLLSESGGEEESWAGESDKMEYE